MKQSYSREENDNFHGLGGRGKREILVKGIKFQLCNINIFCRSVQLGDYW